MNLDDAVKDVFLRLARNDINIDQFRFMMTERLIGSKLGRASMVKELTAMMSSKASFDAEYEAKDEFVRFQKTYNSFVPLTPARPLETALYNTTTEGKYLERLCKMVDIETEKKANMEEVHSAALEQFDIRLLVNTIKKATPETKVAGDACLVCSLLDLYRPDKNSGNDSLFLQKSTEYIRNPAKVADLTNNYDENQTDDSQPVTTQQVSGQSSTQQIISSNNNINSIGINQQLSIGTGTISQGQNSCTNCKNIPEFNRRRKRLLTVIKDEMNLIVVEKEKRVRDMKNKITTPSELLGVVQSLTNKEKEHVNTDRRINRKRKPSELDDEYRRQRGDRDRDRDREKRDHYKTRPSRSRSESSRQERNHYEDRSNRGGRGSSRRRSQSRN